MVALVAVPLVAAACGSDDSPSIAVPVTSTTTQAPTGQQGSKITIEDLAFHPSELQATVGDTITLSHDDSTTHTWTADDGSFDAGELAPGATSSQVMSKAGTIAYHCKIHPSMKGTIVVSG